MSKRQDKSIPHLSLSAYLPAILAMCASVAASNILVQYQFEYWGLAEILTWGAFTYPFAFLVNDLTNRRYGPAAARKVVYAGFFLGVIMSIWLATPRIAIASGSAFLFSQLMDITLTGMPDSSLNFPASFLGIAMPLWTSLALGDFIIKVIMGTVMLLPYGAILAIFAPKLYLPKQ